MGTPLEESAFVYSLWYKVEPGEPAGFAHEGPEHEVLIDMPIAMGRNEITRKEWAVCVAESGCDAMPSAEVPTHDGPLFADEPLHPVIHVSYEQAQDYIAWLNGKVGTKAYRLPTEAEWEYAARAGTTTKFGQGDRLTTDQANIGIFAFDGDLYLPDPDNRQTPVTVDMLDAANAWGLRNMAGNVMEIMMSCMTERHLGLATSSEYLEAAQEASCRRVVKGGSFSTDAEYARPSHRGGGSETSKSRFRGFRIVRNM